LAPGSLHVLYHRSRSPRLHGRCVAARRGGLGRLADPVGATHLWRRLQFISFLRRVAPRESSSFLDGIGLAFDLGLPAPLLTPDMTRRRKVPAEFVGVPRRAYLRSAVGSECHCPKDPSVVDLDQVGERPILPLPRAPASPPVLCVRCNGRRRGAAVRSPVGNTTAREAGGR
jgi:hypothetical protein